MTQITSADIRCAGMDLLARREHGFQELAGKLKRRFTRKKYAFEVEFTESGFNDLLQQVLSRLREEGLQSDARLAQVYIRSRSNRGQGPVKIRAELRSKGLSDIVINHAFDECEVDWFELIGHVSGKKFGDAKLDAQEKARRTRFLQQRGFSFDQINTID